MRGFFAWLLKLQAWLTPIIFAYYGYVTFDARDSNAGFVGVMVGLAMGGLGYVWFAGLADLAETVWNNQEKLTKVHAKLDAASEQLEKIAKATASDGNEDATQFATILSKLNELKTSTDDIYEGLGDVAEETLKRISEVKPELKVVEVPKLNLGNIPESNNR